MNLDRPHPARPLTLGLTLVVVTTAACGREPRSDGADTLDADAVTEAAAPGGTAPTATPTPPSTWAYTCPDGRSFTVHYRDGEALLELSERELRLPRVGGSGARYQSADTLFWDRGGQAILDVRDEWYRGCEGERAESPEDAARRLGYDFRGLGQEPGWLVDVDPEGRIRWVGRYGAVRFVTGAPEVVEHTDERTVWRARTDTHRITVEAVAAPCEDAMSGRPFSHTVTVVVDGEEVHGCGRWLE